MLPRKLHLEQINRFHDAVEELSAQIELETDHVKKGDLCFKYFKITNLIWSKIDDLIEYDIKLQLDDILDCSEDK